MDLIRSVATVALLSMLAYFILVNILENSSHPIHTTGDISAAPSPGPTAPLPKHLDLVPVDEINKELGTTWNTIGEQAPSGGENVTQLSVFNDQAKGVVPSNHDMFEKPADFTSDITNINQFYKNNPEVFDRSATTAPNAAGWNEQSKQMFNNLSSQSPNKEINAYNFETDPLNGISGNSLN